MIQQGFIISTSNGGKLAKILTTGGKTYNEVPVFNPYGVASNQQVPCVLITPKCSSDNPLAIPYSYENLPDLEKGAVQFGNFANDAKILFKDNGEIEISTSDEVNIKGSYINLGDGLGYVLNNMAQMQVVIPTGSSAGTYQVNIVDAGQYKVKA